MNAVRFFGLRRRAGRAWVAAAVGLTMLGAGLPAAQAAGQLPAVGNARSTFETSTTIRLAWRDPAAAAFAGTVVRYARGTDAPASPTSGRLAARLGPARHQLAVHRLVPGARYAFALFARYPDGRFAHRVSIH